MAEDKDKSETKGANNSQELPGTEGRARIQHEDTLVFHRMSWLMSSQSFLLAAFVALINNFDLDAISCYVPDLPQIKLKCLMIYAIILTGVVTGTCSTVGVSAAFGAIKAWKRKTKENEKYHLTSEAKWAWLGGLAAIIPGPTLTSIWFLILYQVWAIIKTHLGPLNLWVPIFVAATAGFVWLLHIMSEFKSESASLASDETLACNSG